MFLTTDNAYIPKSAYQCLHPAAAPDIPGQPFQSPHRPVESARSPPAEQRAGGDAVVQAVSPFFHLLLKWHGSFNLPRHPIFCFPMNLSFPKKALLLRETESRGAQCETRGFHCFEGLQRAETRGFHRFEGLQRAETREFHCFEGPQRAEPPAFLPFEGLQNAEPPAFHPFEGPQNAEPPAFLPFEGLQNAEPPAFHLSEGLRR